VSTVRNIDRVLVAVNGLVRGKEEVVASPSPACSPRALLLETCPGSARRRSHWRWPACSAWTSAASSSRPTCCRRHRRRLGDRCRRRFADLPSRSGLPPGGPGRRDQPGDAAHQSALLEAMAENQVSIEGRTHPLPAPFFVIATQNPVEHYGTFPLPESQMDRFMMTLRLGYPGRDAERSLLAALDTRARLERTEAVIGPREVAALQGEADAVRVAPALLEYVLDLAAASRQSERLLIGVSRAAPSTGCAPPGRWRCSAGGSTASRRRAGGGPRGPRPPPAAARRFREHRPCRPCPRSSPRRPCPLRTPPTGTRRPPTSRSRAGNCASARPRPAPARSPWSWRPASSPSTPATTCSTWSSPVCSRCSRCRACSVIATSAASGSV